MTTFVYILYQIRDLVLSLGSDTKVLDRIIVSLHKNNVSFLSCVINILGNKGIKSWEGAGGRVCVRKDHFSTFIHPGANSINMSMNFI